MGEDQEIEEKIREAYHSQEQANETLAGGDAAVRCRLLAWILIT